MNENNDLEFDLDSLDFKPINKGLGFHHEKKNRQLAQAKDLPTQNLPSSRPLLAKKIGTDNKIETQAPHKVSISNESAIEAFYNFHKKQEEQDIRESKIKSSGLEQVIEKNKSDVSSLVQLTAWTLDFVMLVASYVTMLWIFSIALHTDLSFVIQQSNATDILVFGSILFSIFYIIYFTVLDMTATFGKNVFGLKVVSIDGERLTAKQSFLRSVVSLFSLAILGFPSIVDFQGKLSDTKVIKK